MIFVTIGAQLPFDRMLKAIDRWAGEHPQVEIYAQIGDTDWTPTHMPWCRLMSPAEFDAKVEAADTVIAHAGMGSIISALMKSKPILIMPRRADLREHRNDHQLATARHLLRRELVTVADDEAQLYDWLDRLHALPAPKTIGDKAQPALLDALRTFVDQA